MPSKEFTRPLWAGPPSDSEGNSPISSSRSRDSYTLNCNLAPARPAAETAHPPLASARVWKGLAAATASAMLVAVVLYAVLGDHGAGAAAASEAAVDAAASQTGSSGGAVATSAPAAATAPADSSPSPDGSNDKAGAPQPAAAAALWQSQEQDGEAVLTAPLVYAAGSAGARAQVDADGCGSPAARRSGRCHQLLRRQEDCMQAHEGRCAQCSTDTEDREYWCTIVSDPARLTIQDGWPVPKAGYTLGSGPDGIVGCAAGTAKASPGSGPCSKCTGRTYQPLAGQAACRACPHGSALSADHTACTPPQKTVAINYSALMSAEQLPPTLTQSGGTAQAAHVSSRRVSGTRRMPRASLQRAQLKHLPAEVADMLASFDPQPAAVPVAKQHRNRKTRNI